MGKAPCSRSAGLVATFSSCSKKASLVVLMLRGPAAGMPGNPKHFMQCMQEKNDRLLHDAAAMLPKTVRCTIAASTEIHLHNDAKPSQLQGTHQL